MRNKPRGQCRKDDVPARSATSLSLSKNLSPGLLLAAALGAAALAGGCSSSIQTPLPSLSPSASTSLSQRQKDEAVDELNRVRASHEQDAARSIEESR